MNPSGSAIEAPGLRADWLNAWLAAIGVTVLLPGVKLSWTDEVVPHARFWGVQHDELVPRIWSALPTDDELDHSVIARSLPDAAHEFARNVDLDTYRERAVLERATRSFQLASSVSDLVDEDQLENLPHGQFDPPVPRGETLWSRARKCREALTDASQLSRSLFASGDRRPLNGLGFDARRLTSGVRGGGRASTPHADPGVELLAFAALKLFPVTGKGRGAWQRLWTGGQFKRSALIWFSWAEALDSAAIDAVLDQPNSVAVRRWGVVPFKPTNASDTTRALFSEPLP
jgi:hypothetical protein